MKIYIVTHRLPVRAVAHQDHYTFVSFEAESPTALTSLRADGEQTWIGWPGVRVDTSSQQAEARQQLSNLHCHPVFLTSRQQETVNEGYCSHQLWPLCHYQVGYLQNGREDWADYIALNQTYCEEICRCAKSDDWVWIQDVQLMLLPALLRKRIPQLHIGYFHSIPFPSYELFRTLPQRNVLLEGLLGADFIAFQTHEYLRHFISAAERIRAVNFSLNETQVGERRVRVDALPMGIDYLRFHQCIEDEKVWQEIENDRTLFGQHQLLVSLQTLDESQGTLLQLEAYRNLIELHREHQGKVVLNLVILPPHRPTLEQVRLKQKIDAAVENINTTFGSDHWTPVCYSYHHLNFEELAARLHVADVALFTPLRDGMSLMAKAYVATKVHQPGVLLLSERSGAAVELTDALLVNPNDVEQMTETLYQALHLPFNEKLGRLEKMQEVLARQTAQKWAADVRSEWQQVIDKNEYLRTKNVRLNITAQIGAAYAAARHRLILLDYDGALIPSDLTTEQAAPSTPVLCALRDLCADSRNRVVINSGRNAEQLEKWLGCYALDFTTDEGACYKEQGRWHHVSTTPIWSEGLLSILRLFVTKTPGTYIETKATQLIWHYQKSDAWLGELRARQLIQSLVTLCRQRHLQIEVGNKSVTIKAPEYNKTTEMERLLHSRKERYDFILAIGNDTLGNELFLSLPKSAITIHVGAATELATYNLSDQAQTIPFLNSILACDGRKGRTTIPCRVTTTLSWWKKILKFMDKRRMHSLAGIGKWVNR